MGGFEFIERGVDEKEHSLEMHLPYIRKVFEGKDISFVPIMVGHLDDIQKQDIG